MREEEMLMLAAKVYEKAEEDVKGALLRLEKIAYEARYEGLLSLDELREQMQSEEFIEKEYLLRGMEWVTDGMEPKYLEKILENGIDTECGEIEKVFRFLYMKGLICIQSCEPMSPYLRHCYFASFFSVKNYTELLALMEGYTSKRDEERKWNSGIDLLQLHYDVDDEEVAELEKKLEKINVDDMQKLYKHISEQDVITLLLICGEVLHQRLTGLMNQRFLERLRNASEYGKYIRYPQIKSAMENWDRQLVLWEGECAHE